MSTVPSTIYTYPLNGSLKDFPINFEYLARKFVVVTLIGNDRKTLVLNADYRFSTRSQITTTKGWGTADGYNLIEIKRVTSATERLVDFSDGSILKAYDLNTAQIQSLHIAEEARNLATETIAVNGDGNLDARGRRIVNVAAAVNPTDAVTLGQVTGWDSSALNSANRAAASANSSAASAVVSEDWAKRAQVSASEAQNLPRTVRVRPEDPYLDPLPDISTRANKLLGFDTRGMPTALIPNSGSSAEVFLEFQKVTGSGLIGHNHATYNTVEKALTATMDGSYTAPFTRKGISNVPGTNMRPTNYGQLAAATCVSIWEFAYVITVKPVADDMNTWDWTPAFDLAAYLLNSPNPTLPSKDDVYIVLPAGVNYKLRYTTLNKHQHLIMNGGCLSPFDPNATLTHLIRLIGHNRIYNVNVDMDYATGYSTVFWCRGRYIDFICPSIWRARLAFTFGDPAWLDPAQGVMGDSEINISGGEVNWGCQVSALYGQNTIVTMSNGFRCYGFKRSIPDNHPRRTAWMAIPDNVHINYGAFLYLTGCFTGNFSGDTATLLSQMGPITGDPQYFNRYGTFILNSTHIETGVLLSCGSTTYPAQSKDWLLQMSGCHGYMTGSPGGYWINAGAKCLQRIDIRACGFYGKAYPNLVYNVTGPCYIEPSSFINANRDFFTSSTIRYPLNSRGLAVVHNTASAQTLTASLTPVIFPTVQNVDMASALRGDWYNLTNGDVVAGVDCRNVRINVGLYFVNGLPSDVTTLAVLVDGSQVDICSLIGQTPRAEFTLRSLTKSQVVTIKASCSASRVLSGNISTFIKVTVDT